MATDRQGQGRAELGVPWAGWPITCASWLQQHQLWETGPCQPQGGLLGMSAVLLRAAQTELPAFSTDSEQQVMEESAHRILSARTFLPCWGHFSTLQGGGEHIATAPSCLCRGGAVCARACLSSGWISGRCT